MQTEKENIDGSSLNRAKILIVDDDPELRMALKLRLRANHYETVSASDGYSAIALAQKERPNLIILDLGLPAGNGFIVLKRLQESDTLSHIPVIVLTARDRCWISVRLGSAVGRRLDERTLERGDSVRFVARRLWIRIGAPWNLEARLNGKPVRLPTSIADVIVTPTGLGTTS